MPERKAELRVRVRLSAKKKLEELVEITGLSQSRLIEQAICDFLKRKSQHIIEIFNSNSE